MEFKGGDIVTLKSGGPKMTVAYDDKGDITCQWFDGGELKTARFFHFQLTPNTKD